LPAYLGSIWDTGSNKAVKWPTNLAINPIKSYITAPGPSLRRHKTTHVPTFQQLSARPLRPVLTGCRGGPRTHSVVAAKGLRLQAYSRATGLAQHAANPAHGADFPKSGRARCRAGQERSPYRRLGPSWIRLR